MAVDDSYTKVLLHFDGDDASTTFTDESGKTWTATGAGAELDTADYEFGDSSFTRPTTSGRYISTPTHDDFEFGSGNFTIDFWYKDGHLNGSSDLLGHPFDTGWTSSVWMQLQSGNPACFLSKTGSGWDLNFTSTENITTGWNHIALVRNGTTVTVYVNGVSGGGGTLVGALAKPALDFKIGARAGNEGQTYTSWMDEFRISKGIARWTSNFTPPTAAYSPNHATYDKTFPEALSVDDSIDVVGIKSFGDSFSVDDTISVWGVARIEEGISFDDSIVASFLQSTVSDSFSVDDSLSVFNSQQGLSDSFILSEEVSAEKRGIKVTTLYQFNKDAESHFYAQLANGRVMEATAQPPTVTTGSFGSQVFEGATTPIPGSWTVVNDTMIYASGVDQFQVYPGSATDIEQIVVYRSSDAPPAIPTVGDDYTEVLRSGGVADISNVGALAYDCVFIRSSVPINSLSWTVSAVNTTASVVSMSYWKGTWGTVSGLTDNTSSGGCSLGKSGTMTWTLPTDSLPLYLFGGIGYWYKMTVASGSFDSATYASAITYGTTWQSMINMWDGVSLDAVEAQFYDASATTYTTFGGSSIDIDEMTSSDALYFNSADRSLAAYFDFGDTPNSTAGVGIGIAYWNGSTWIPVSGQTDDTDGFTKSGWVTWTLCANEQPRQFNASQYYSYWYMVTVSTTLTDTVNVGIMTIPYYEISNLGNGLCCTVWKNRGCYVFSKSPADITVTAIDEPMQVSSTTNSAVLKAGDGRQNQIKAMKSFYNELIVLQEEIGEAGGCITLFEGYSPATFGKLVLSQSIGTMSAKTFEVIEGIQLSETRVGTVGVTLSHYGIFMIDGKSVVNISEHIKNYFDTTKSECIRKGYENEMWLKWDSSQKVIRLGLVSGSSATLPNVFPVYDPKTREWYFDSFGQTLTCMSEVKAGSGDISVLQVAGGSDGYVYQANYGDSDVTTAIDAYVVAEFDGGGVEMELSEFVLRTKSQTAGNVTVTPYNNGVAGGVKTLTMTALRTNEQARRHRDNFGGVKSDHFALKVRNNEASTSMTLLDYAVGIKELTGQ